MIGCAEVRRGLVHLGGPSEAVACVSHLLPPGKCASQALVLDAQQPPPMHGLDTLFPQSCLACSHPLLHLHGAFGAMRGRATRDRLRCNARLSRADCKLHRLWGSHRAVHFGLNPLHLQVRLLLDLPHRALRRQHFVVRQPRCRRRQRRVASHNNVPQHNPHVLQVGLRPSATALRPPRATAVRPAAIATARTTSRDGSEGGVPFLSGGALSEGPLETSPMPSRRLGNRAFAGAPSLRAARMQRRDVLT